MFKRGWLWLTRMRTAIVLLLVLAAGAAVGSFFPQRPIDRAAVEAWIDTHPGWEPVMRAFGIFDVYGSWWFMAIYGLLLVSLVGCMTRRYSQQIRAVRAVPRHPGNLTNRQRYVRARTDASAQQAAEISKQLLRRRRFRVAVDGTSVSAERGHIRETGSLLFHTSILGVLAGVTVARLFGVSGQVLVVEGDTFVDSYLNYDSITEGRLFRGNHTEFSMRLDDFNVEWHPSGIPREYVSEVTVSEADGSERSARVRVNEPLKISGRNVYQIAWGWAPVLEIRQNGKLLYSGPTVFLPDANTWTGVAKIPQTTPQQMGLAMQLFVDPFEDEDGVLRDRNRAPRDPVIVAQVMSGDLGLDRPQNVYALDPRGLTRVGQEIVGRGRVADLPNGVTLAFRDMVQYSVFQIGYNPGTGILLGAAIGMIIGLMPALYSFRRRVWIRASTDDRGTLVEIAGHAFQRQQAADAEFAEIVSELDDLLQQPKPLISHDRSAAR
jgi:cytochrome c biogenesis protein